ARDLFEGDAARQLIQVVAADDQPSGLPVDLRQHRVRGDDAFQSIRHDGLQILLARGQKCLQPGCVNLDQSNQYMPAQPDWIAAEEARDRLGVRPQTLYAYVSRGRVQVRPDPRDPRRSLYRAADIAALAQRKARSRKVSDVATGAIAWGEPVLSSEITTVAGGRLFYRGRDAIRLAETETLESVARLLRGGHGAALKRTERPDPPRHPDMRTRAYLALALRAGSD